MDRYRLIMVLSICVPPMVQAHAHQTGSSDVSSMAIVQRSLAVGNRILELRYEIKNISAHDVWICDSMNVGETTMFEACLAEDKQTVLIERRFDMPLETFREQPVGRYTRLRAGQTRVEVMLLKLPVYPRHVLSGAKPPTPPVHATRLTLRIGYYDGDLRAMVSQSLVGTERGAETNVGVGTTHRSIRGIAGLPFFTVFNEGRNRDEEVLIPYTWQTLKGERIMALTVEDVRIPYADSERQTETSPPRLGVCSNIQLQFRPSAMEFFFPYADERTLLNPAERKYLQSMETLTIKDKRLLEAIAEEVGAGSEATFVVGGGALGLVCYSDRNDPMALTAYSNGSILTSDGQAFQCTLPSLRKVTPEIASLQVRMWCAANLRDLWYRLRMRAGIQGERTGSSEKPNVVYPSATHWCDAIWTSYDKHDSKEEPIPPWTCPATSEGGCHYAMYPDCRADSPGDMVLLFETKAGWNQHGGPELFTLDHHKGGLVLLNDGTVKFIRTEEELKLLRWK